ncbi:hypothetical protein D9611_012343 [Ephemerocybe angulata]|uniref:(2E,6E)-farnesyl diphosphate synthase n=1 Tax=Ephemerocybe angulata TaxID=980116 RepID=A0A8H5CF25_9AGAR|nr:hypothetical protein D9611_012343 [Tulosesus angulatus]
MLLSHPRLPLCWRSRISTLRGPSRVPDLTHRRPACTSTSYTDTGTTPLVPIRLRTMAIETSQRPLPPTPHIYKPTSPLATVNRMSDKAARRAKFEQAFQTIRGELIEHIKGEGMPEEAVEWYKNNLDYNVPGGKLNRGMSVVDTAEIIKGSTLTEAEYFRAAVLGWCIELLQAFFLVADDMMDASITRRGQPCWYHQPKIGMVAINDGCMLESAIYHLLKVPRVFSPLAFRSPPRASFTSSATLLFPCGSEMSLRFDHVVPSRPGDPSSPWVLIR